MMAQAGASVGKAAINQSVSTPDAWCDLHVQKTLVSRSRRFALDVRLSSNSPRIALVGPSGIGKTQVLQAVAGLMRPDGGHIRIGGEIFYDAAGHYFRPARHRRVGFLFQDYALFPHLSVLANVGFGLRRGPWGRLNAQQKDEVMYWLERFHIAHLAQQRCFMLSGGQQQRVALARLAILKPRVLLLDEPFSAMDPALRQVMRGEIDSLLNSLGIPLLMVSHDEQDQIALNARMLRLGQREDRTVCLDSL